MSETSCEMITRALHARDPSAMVFAGHAVMALDELRATLTARESELEAAQRRVAEMEKEVQRVTRNCQDNLDGKREQERLKKLCLKQLREACGLTHIPGKEDDDGEMH